jgi:hypothetical protein
LCRDHLYRNPFVGAAAIPHALGVAALAALGLLVAMLRSSLGREPVLLPGPPSARSLGQQRALLAAVAAAGLAAPAEVEGLAATPTGEQEQDVKSHPREQAKARHSR